MTAVVAPVVLPAPLPAGPQAEARKRRREILASQRSHALTTSAAELELSNAHQTACAILPAIEIAMAAPASKRQKTELAAKSKKTGKKPQMKYDPDVPMTKEEATAWRREQRRKRNRESAAASRQRQRDRINELEGEVEEWKTKYESIMAAIAKLEQQKAEGTADAVLTHLPPLPETTVSKFVSPPASPGHSPSYEPSEPVASPIASSSLIPPPMVSPQELSSSKGVVKMETSQGPESQVSLQIKKVPRVTIVYSIASLQEKVATKITIPAVKITEAPTFPLLPATVNDDFIEPDTCLSTDVRLEPTIEDTLPPLKQQRLPNLLTDEENEDELGEFLLDAVQWFVNVQKLILANGNKKAGYPFHSKPPVMSEDAARRRRRKRRRPLEGTAVGSNQRTNAGNHGETRGRKLPNKSKRSIRSSFEDDSSLNFLDSSGGAKSDRKPIQVSLLKLLTQRQTGTFRPLRQHQRCIQLWQQQALVQFTKNPIRIKRTARISTARRPNNDNPAPQRREWRPFAKRSIPFTKLGTPVVDAVLALERKGSYVLSLGAQHPGSEVPLLLALRFYGVPSPAGMERRKKIAGKAMGITPLLQTVPLLYNDIPSDETMEDSIFNFRRNISPASTPVYILISNEWKIGMAMFQPSDVWREEGPVGNLVLFSLPGGGLDARYCRAFVCKNIRMGGTTSFTLRNLMWRVEKLPCWDPSREKQMAGHCDCILQLPGYLVLNDEEDGFRLTWVLDELWSVVKKGPYSSQNGESVLGNDFTPTSQIISHQDTWEEVCYDKASGSRIPQDPTSGASLNPTNGVSICCEAFLHIDALLGEILNRRKKKVSEPHPEYYYDLISIAFGGQVADVVICFLRGGGRPGALGVFVRVDLFTGTAQELDWVQGRKVEHLDSLEAWSKSLALNRRMQHVGAGPFSTDAKRQTRDWSRLCQESIGIDCDQEDDYDASFWDEYVGSPQDKRPPKTISLASIYPDCDLITNDAIRSCLPVPSLQCKDSPIQLIYG